MKSNKIDVDHLVVVQEVTTKQPVDQALVQMLKDKAKAIQVLVLAADHPDQVAVAPMFPAIKAKIKIADLVQILLSPSSLPLA